MPGDPQTMHLPAYDPTEQKRFAVSGGRMPTAGFAFFRGSIAVSNRQLTTTIIANSDDRHWSDVGVAYWAVEREDME